MRSSRLLCLVSLVSEKFMWRAAIVTLLAARLLWLSPTEQQPSAKHKLLLLMLWLCYAFSFFDFNFQVAQKEPLRGHGKGQERQFSRVSHAMIVALTDALQTQPTIFSFPFTERFRRDEKSKMSFIEDGWIWVMDVRSHFNHFGFRSNHTPS